MLVNFGCGDCVLVVEVCCADGVRCVCVSYDVAAVVVFFQAEDGIRALVRSRGLGDVYKRQVTSRVRLLRALRFLRHCWYSAYSETGTKIATGWPLAWRSAGSCTAAVRSTSKV